MPDTAMDTHHHSHTGVTDLSWEDFGRHARDLADKITATFTPDAVVGIAKGGLMPAVVLASALRRDLYTIKISSRINEEIAFEEPRIVQLPPECVAGKSVLLVDDISISGKTLGIAAELLRREGAVEVRMATLAVHGGSWRPEWYTLETDDIILLPWDRDVLLGGRWRMNPEYAEELERLPSAGHGGHADER